MKLTEPQWDALCSLQPSTARYGCWVEGRRRTIGALIRVGLAEALRLWPDHYRRTQAGDNYHAAESARREAIAAEAGQADVRRAIENLWPVLRFVSSQDAQTLRRTLEQVTDRAKVRGEAEP